MRNRIQSHRPCLPQEVLGWNSLRVDFEVFLSRLTFAYGTLTGVVDINLSPTYSPFGHVGARVVGSSSQRNMG